MKKKPTAFAIVFLSLIFVIGATTGLNAIIAFKEYFIYITTPIKEIETAKPGKIIKTILKPNNSNMLYSQFSQKPCTYYKTDYIIYHNAGKTALPEVQQSFKERNYLLLSSNYYNYVLFLEKPTPTMLFLSNNTYIKDKYTNEYEYTNEITFRNEEETVEEKEILPNDKILIFGQFTGSRYIPEYKSYALVFAVKEPPNILFNPFQYYIQLISSIFSFDLTSFVVSTEDEKTTGNEIYLLAGCVLLAFSVLFAGPAIFIFLVNTKKL